MLSKKKMHLIMLFLGGHFWTLFVTMFFFSVRDGPAFKHCLSEQLHMEYFYPRNSYFNRSPIYKKP